MKKWTYDFILSIGIMVVVIVMLIYSVFLQSPREKLFLARPDVYLGMWILVLGFLALLLMIRALKMKKTEDGQSLGTPIWCNVGVFTAVIIFIYLLILNKIGFILDSVFMLWTISMVYSFNMGEKDNRKNWRDKAVFIKQFVKSGIFAFLASYISFYIFTKVLTSRLPTFSLFK